MASLVSSINLSRVGRTVLRSFGVVLAGVLFTWSAQTHQEDAERFHVALFPFALRGLDSLQAEQVWSQWAASLDRTGRYRVMSRSAMDAIMKEIGYTKLDECQTASCASYFGNILRTEVALQGAVQRFADGYIMDVRLVNVSSGNIVFEERTIFNGDFDSFLGTQIPASADAAAQKHFSSSTQYRWYVIGGLIVGASAVIYVVSKSLGFFGKSRQTEDQERDPPEIPGN
jgi:hypothetical protein